MTPWSKRLAIFLALSIGVNLLLLGLLIGRGFGRPRGGHPGPRHAAASASADWREARRHPLLREPIERRRAELSSRRNAIEASRAAVREALVREPFDRPALEAALGALRGETSKSQELLHAALVDAATGATVDQRRDLANKWDTRRRGKH